VDKVKHFLKEALINLMKGIYLLTDEIIFRLDKKTFCAAFNARSIILRWDVTFKFDPEINKYNATSGEIKQHYLNKRQALNAYRVSLSRRCDYMKKVYHLDKINLAADDVVIDCGANVGDLYMLLKRDYKDIKYMAFEPSPSEFSCLQMNAAAMQVFNQGLWNSESKLEFYVSSDGADSSFIKPRKYDRLEKIKTSRLDEIIPSELKVKLLKIEAEGAEPEAIEGAENILQNVEYITADLGFERGVNQESTICPVVNFLLARNFELIDLTSGRLVALFRNRRFS